MRQLQWAGVVCIQKYLAIFDLLNTIFQPLCASPTANPSQSNGDLENSSFATGTTSHDFSLKIISKKGNEIRCGDSYSELLTFIQPYYHLQTSLGNAEIKLKSLDEFNKFFYHHFDLMKLFSITDAKLFCIEISKVISISIPLHFRHSHSFPVLVYNEANCRGYQMLYILVYSWVYRNALLRCNFDCKNLECEEMVNSIRKTIEKIFEFMLMIHPSSREYINVDCHQKKDRLFKGEMFKFLSGIQTDIFKADLLISGMKLEDWDHKKSWRWSNPEHNGLVALLREDCLKFCEFIRSPFDYMNDLSLLAFELRFKQLEKLSERFKKSLSKVENIPEDEATSDRASIIEFCRSKLEAYESFYVQYETTLMKYVKVFGKLSEIMDNVFDKSIAEIIEKNDETMEDVVWIRGLMVFQPYCWETAFIIKSKPKIAEKVAASIIEVLEQEDSIYFNKFISKYNLYFSGVLRSICDIKQLSSYEKTKVPSTDYIILKITQEKCGIRDLMDLYHAVCKENLGRIRIQVLITDLLQTLYNKRIKNFGDIQKNTKACIPIMLYAINILYFGILGKSSRAKKFPEQFKKIITYTLELNEHILKAKSSKNDFLRIISNSSQWRTSSEETSSEGTTPEEESSEETTFEYKSSEETASEKTSSEEESS